MQNLNLKDFMTRLKLYFDKCARHRNKTLLVSALKNEFSIKPNGTVNPINFATTYIPIENGLRDTYIGDVCQELPFAIVKDDSLIRTKLAKRKIDFLATLT
ncbi:MAG: hypothetical protein IPL12_15870 [Bacteroidetes bacterium]|nr:hypothetical protein [Bacteroidota bacterium]